MSIAFDWDFKKAAINLKKHGVSFVEAATVFRDPLSYTVDDPEHSLTENRFLTIGLSLKGRVLVVSHTELLAAIRVISARKATSRERMYYEQKRR